MSKIQTKTLKYVDLADVCEKNSPLDFWLDGFLRRQHMRNLVEDTFFLSMTVIWGFGLWVLVSAL